RLALAEPEELHHEEDVARVHDDGRRLPFSFDVRQLLDEVAGVVRVPLVEEKRIVLALGAFQIVQKTLGSCANPPAVLLAALVGNGGLRVVDGDLNVITMPCVCHCLRTCCPAPSARRASPCLAPPASGRTRRPAPGTAPSCGRLASRQPSKAAPACRAMRTAWPAGRGRLRSADRWREGSQRADPIPPQHVCSEATRAPVEFPTRGAGRQPVQGQAVDFLTAP